MRRLLVVSLVIAQACQAPSDPGPTFTPVDSATGTPVLDLYVDFSTFSMALGPTPMSWTNGGSTLMIASPTLQYPPVQSSLWALTVSSGALAKLFTWPTASGIVGVDCRPAMAECDLVHQSGRVLRRGTSGDTTQILLKSAGGHYASANGRFLVYTEDGTALRLLDATTGTQRTVHESSVVTWLGKRAVAVSDDGAEVAVALQSLAITRYRPGDGTVTTSTIPSSQAGSGYIRALRWVGPTLYALVVWYSADQSIFTQHRVDAGAGELLGLTGQNVYVEAESWRPELGRLVVHRQSACDRVTIHDTCLVEQWELELLRGGVTTRVARNRYGFWRLSLAPGGRQLAYGQGRVLLKELPE